MRDVILALDMGGTSIKQALVDMAGEPLDASICPFADDSRSAMLQTLREAAAMGRAQALAVDCRIIRVGVACPGPFDFRLLTCLTYFPIFFNTQINGYLPSRQIQAFLFP